MTLPLRLLGLLAVIGAAVSVTAPPAVPAAKRPARSWAAAEIRVVTERGLMGGSARAFRPDAPLTSGALARLVAGLTGKPVATVPDPAAPVTIARLNARLVRALGLAPAAAGFARAARAAGLAPPSRFGTEVVARLLGLRFNHPTAEDNLEPLPRDAATRAEAAYSAARILRFGGWEVGGAQAAAAAIALPAPSSWQLRILATAVRFIGYPYVYGGTSENAEAPFGVPARGGFDCSGFVWRIYKLHRYPGAPKLSGTFRGRGTSEMSGEVPRAARISFARLRPADVVLFGARGPRSKPAEVNHAGIYLGGGWMIHSSSQGVALAPLTGWYRERFAWARRPLAEAGLE